MNERDSEIMGGMLRDLGYGPTEQLEEADLILLNTCCVREKAELKVYSRLGELKHLKDQKPDLVIGICGCMVQRTEVAEHIRRRYPYVDLIFGTHNTHQLPELIKRAAVLNAPLLEVWDQEGEIVENLPTRREGTLKAYVSIALGCNNFCTYCIVPYVRGRERSRKIADISTEVAQLGQEGFKEVTLLGQNVNSYGRDLEPPVDFADLLQALEPIVGVEWIRYLTSHPRDFSDRMIKTIAQLTKVCEHFHLPAQSGSNDILKIMNRGYTRERYLELVGKIREVIPRASITTDLIVGFPGETDEDFQQTLDLLRQVQFDAAFTFIYSPRSGTPAATMPDQVPKELKTARLTELVRVQNEITLARNRTEIGQSHQVLIEKRDGEVFTGRTRTNKVVKLRGSEELVGQLVKVRVTGAKMWSLEAELL